MKTLYLYDFLRGANPLERLDIEKGVPYLVIGVQSYEYYDEYEEEEKVCDDYDINRLKVFNVDIQLLGVVKNPRYLDQVGHMLQVAIITFKEDL